MSKKYWETYFTAIKKQNWEQAKVSLENLANIDRENPHVQLKLGDIYQRTGQTANAITAYHKSAWVLTKQGFAQKALALYKIILRLDSYNEEAINRSNELMMGIESAKKQKQPAAPFVTTFEETPVQKEETVSGLTEKDTDSTFQSSADISDMIDRTSYKDKPVEETAPPATPELKDSDMQPQSETADASQMKEAPAAQIPSFFSSLAEDEVQYLLYKTDPHSFSPGQLILEEGDSGDSVFFIESGHAKVISHIRGKEIELATLSPGDVFGEVAFLTGRPRTATVIALDELEVREFTKLLLEEIFERYPSTLEKLQDFYHCRIEDTLQTVKDKMKKNDSE